MLGFSRKAPITESRLINNRSRDTDELEFLKQKLEQSQEKIANLEGIKSAMPDP
jgi:hypothetical protein